MSQVCGSQATCFHGQQLVVARKTQAFKRSSVAPRAAFELKPPPYPLDALESKGMSKSTLEFHWGKHHQAYVTNLNNQIKGTELDNATLEEVILKSWNGGKPTPEFNNAAQVWNHTFFWESMSPNGGGAPSGALAEAIDKAFGSFDDFKTQFKAAGTTQFGSGWAWLVAGKDGSLKITKTPNAVLPLVEGETAILTMDVWEHAYYLDFQNRRPDYETNFLDNLVDWGAVAERYAAATA